APPDISHLSLHDALPISVFPYVTGGKRCAMRSLIRRLPWALRFLSMPRFWFLAPLPSILAVFTTSRKSRTLTNFLAPSWERALRSEEHTSELQSRFDLVC